MRLGGAPVLALFAALVLSPGAALDASPADDTVVKVIALRHRPAADLVPILRPLVGPDGGLDALDTRLVVRATPQALARIEQALVELDRPLRSLLITVSQGLRRSSEREGSGVGGAASGGGTTVVVTPPSTGGAATVETRTTRTVVQGAFGAQSQTSEGETHQQVRTVEGGPAFIKVGRSEPVPTVEVVPTPAGPTLVQGTAYAEAGTGFYVRPRLAGDMVTLELWAESTEGTPSGAIEGQRLGSTVVGRLGEWIEVGSALKEAETNVRSLGGAARGTTLEERSVRLRVDEVR
ncbi:MAG TPA: secretin N-terminal domain-containing protein [Vicinamibacteria bacterium]